MPRITAPALRKRATSGASRLVTLLASARLPAVVGNEPALSILSLISTGWPASGPRSLPASTARACSIAVGSIASTECICGSTAAMRCSAACTLTSAGPATCAAAAVARASEATPVEPKITLRITPPSLSLLSAARAARRACLDLSRPSRVADSAGRRANRARLCGRHRRHAPATAVTDRRSPRS